jgi:hypothetical protein
MTPITLSVGAGRLSPAGGCARPETGAHKGHPYGIVVIYLSVIKNLCLLGPT